MLYAAIGHVCQDVLPQGRALGGTAAYAALTAQALGWSAAVVTRAHASLDLSDLHGAECVRIDDEATTTFQNVETVAGRVQHVLAVAGPIRPTDIPPPLRHADVFHLAPVAGEVEPAIVEAVDRRAFVGVTPQGWMRQWDDAGRVSRRTWPDEGGLLRRADAIVLSTADVEEDWRAIVDLAAHTRLLVATQGRQGCTVFEDGRPARVPVAPIEEIDPVGAGDIFAAAFFIQRRVTGDAVLAARRANCLAARSVRRRGLKGAPTADDVRECLAA